MMDSKNKKIFLIVGIVLLVIIITVIILATRGGEPIPPDNPDNPIIIDPVEEKSLAGNIIVDKYEVNNSSKNRDVRTKIPRIINLDDKSFQEYMNKKMQKAVTDYQDEIELMIDEETPNTTLYKYVVSYDSYANDRYLSLVISSDYQTGGMRSNSWKDTYNIDVTKGNNHEIALKDLFAASKDYKKAILSEINKQAAEKDIELVGGSGLSSLPDTQKFYIQDGKLVICFDPAAIAPYVDGELNFVMPFEYKDGKFVI